MKRLTPRRTQALDARPPTLGARPTRSLPTRSRRVR